MAKEGKKKDSDRSKARHEQADYYKARAKVMKLRALYMHATVYVLIIGMFAALNFATSPNHLWFLYLAIGWGIFLAIHALGRSRLPGQLGGYVIIIGFLAFINIMTYPGYLWFLWPAAGWGFAIVIQYVTRNAFGKEWEKRKIQKYMGKNQGR